MSTDDKKEDIQDISEENNSDNSNNPFASKEVSEQTENEQESDEFQKLKAEHEALNNNYLRLAADFDNYRKRQAQERELLLQYGTQETLKKMIEVLDNFERANESCKNLEDADKVKECFTVLEKQTKEVLSKLGLVKIETEGVEFDPNYHEAIMQTPTSEYKENSIISEFQKGYMYQNRVLRPSRVNVAVSE